MPESSAWQELCRWEFEMNQSDPIEEGFLSSGSSHIHQDEGSTMEGDSSDACEKDRDDKVIVLTSTTTGKASGRGRKSRFKDIAFIRGFPFEPQIIV